MRKKEQKLVITFYTTADAMGMEKMCKAEGLPGRIIPVPRSITAGCGLAWCTEIEHKEIMEAGLKKAGIEASGIQECLV